MRTLIAFTLTAALYSHGTLAVDDARQLVSLPAPMTQHMLLNMKDHLLAITEIQRAIGSGEYQIAADIAEQRIGLSSLQSHGASHMAPFMPKPMQDIGTQMHRAASQFALAAEQVCLRSRDAFWDIQVPKTHSIFDSLLCSDRPAVITIPYRTLQLRCSCTTPS